MKITRDNCKFSYWMDDVKTADVTIKNGIVSCKRYTDDILDLPFGKVSDKLVTRQTIDLFFRERCIPEHRANIQQALEMFGLEKFDAFKICRITNGRMIGEPYYIMWHDEEFLQETSG